MAMPSSALSKAVAGDARKIGGYTIDGAVYDSIKSAAKTTGVDFAFLMAKAAQESGFRPEVKAATSSATGLYQFLDSTWLQMVKERGAAHGLGWAADKISDGFQVRDASARKQILDLRKDPAASAALGAEFTKANQEHIEAQMGRKANSTDLYLAHFLGAGGATKFLKAIERNAATPAANLMPSAAGANQSIFYDRESGKPRTVGEIYKLFERSIARKIEAFGGEATTVAAEPKAARASSAYAAGAQRAAGVGPTGIGPLAGAGDRMAAGKLDGEPNISLLFMLSLIEQDLAGPADVLGKGGDESAPERQQRARKAYI